MERVADDRVLRLARLTVKLLTAANLVSAAGFLMGGLLTFPMHDWVATHLSGKYGKGLDADGVILALRVMFALGVGACAVARVVLDRLAGMIATVGQGDPFIAANARRLEDLGWALLVWQVLDLAFGALIAWLDRLGVDHAEWTPGISGWIVVLLVFVLARVFRLGAAMRDDLEGTV